MNNSSFIGKLKTLNTSLADHSVNVANFAVYLAMVQGIGDQKTLELVYLGALMHDYGKAKVPPQVLENPSSIKYSQAIQDHPARGAGMMRKIDQIPETVARIVEQHHEQFNGKGYPAGMHGDKILDLAKIVCMANLYDNMLEQNKMKPQVERHRLAIKFIEYDKGKHFDPEFVERAIEGLKLAFGNYKR